MILNQIGNLTYLLHSNAQMRGNVKRASVVPFVKEVMYVTSRVFVVV